MVKYNVTIKIETVLAEEWLHWMISTFIPKVMETGYFASSSINELRFPKEEIEEGRTFSVQYYAESTAQLNEFLDQHAPGLQREHADRYREKFVIFRTILEEIEAFDYKNKNRD